MAAETEAPNLINLNTQEQFIFLMSQENRVLNYKKNINNTRMVYQNT